MNPMTNPHLPTMMKYANARRKSCNVSSSSLYRTRVAVRIGANTHLRHRVVQVGRALKLIQPISLLLPPPPLRLLLRPKDARHSFPADMSRLLKRTPRPHLPPRNHLHHFPQPHCQHRMLLLLKCMV